MGRTPPKAFGKMSPIAGPDDLEGRPADESSTAADRGGAHQSDRLRIPETPGGGPSLRAC
jgi:hypothetical protein